MASTLANRKAPEAPAPNLGPDNVFADFGLADADERVLKATLVSRIRAVVIDRKLTQVKAGEIMGLPQPKVSELVSGGATGFSAERLIRLLNSLGVSVSIALREEPNWEAGTTFVHFDREPDADMVAPEREQSDEEEQVAQHALGM
jgi:predicted XRE-type DNA-binding protein